MPESKLCFVVTSPRAYGADGHFPTEHSWILCSHHSVSLLYFTYSSQPLLLGSSALPLLCLCCPGSCYKSHFHLSTNVSSWLLLMSLCSVNTKLTWLFLPSIMLCPNLFLNDFVFLDTIIFILFAPQTIDSLLT